MATAPEDLILPFSITALILRCIYVILRAPLFGSFLFAVFVLFFLHNYVSFQSLERDFNRILREYRLLRALSYDKVRLSNSEAEIDMRARDLWKLEDHPKMTVLLDPAEVDWMDIAECVVSRATVFIDRFEKYKERRKKPAVAAVRYIWTLNNYFIKDALSFEMKQIKEEINAHLKKNVDICGTLERSRTQIRSLQDRPIEHESISHRENVCSAADLVSSIVQKIDHQIAIKPYSVYGLTEKIELIKLQLLLLGAFMKDLEGVEFLSETEKVWVEEHKEIIDEAQRAIESFIHRRGGWFSTFSNLMARRKLKGDMKIIDAAFSDLYRRKERYGFKFIRRDQISKFDTRSPNEEEIQIKNKVKGIEDKKHYWLKQLPVSLTGEGDQVKFLSMMCVPWEKMHRLTEEVIAIEGVDNFRRTWLMQMKCTVDVVEETIEAYIKDEAARNTDYTSFGDSFFAYDPHSNVNSFFTGLPDYFLLYKSTYDRRHEVSVEIERMWQVINCFERTIKAYQIEIREESTSVVGLKEDIGVLISRLTNREPVVSIVGMRGIGKTTLAKKVFNHEVILKQFHNNRYWVSIGHKSLLNKIEMLVLGVLESQEEQRGREYWIKELRHFLGEERYLLVLEDINTKETWDTLKAAFPATTNGSTIMLTTRHKSVASHADQSSTQHVLRLRTKEESWKLFTQMVHLPPEIPPESEKIIKAKVVGRCGGLPLAIFHSGYRLIGEHVTQENSSTVLESINCYQESWIEAVGNEEFPVQLVKCLSYIRLFPRDYEIPARRVAASWVAEELLQQRAEDSPECVAEKCLADLKNRYIIQVLETKPDGKIKTFCLHYALSERLPNESSVQRLADYGKDEISQLDLREYRNLVTFLSFDRYRSKFVQPSGAALKNLQTLWGVFVDEDSPLTNGLNRLMNLRKLKLAFQLELSRRKVLAEWISQLNHLQSLWLKSIGEMGEPLDLYLKPLSNLRNLSSLYLFGRLENPSIMEHLPQSLTEVTLSASQLSDDPMPKLGKLPNLRSLCLYSGSYKGTTMVCSIDDFPQLLVLKLWMLDTLQRWDVQERAMRNLRELEIRSCNELEIPTGLTCLETLQELKLTNMPEDFNIKIQNNFTEAEEQYPDKLFTPSIMIKY
ncbi:putative disease resistance protein [Quercus suber]|uniref:Disease resistance protein n=1 Tax=Quercus suber TaxID=58331 RepID=A0AAW0KMS3_QUESU